MQRWLTAILAILGLAEEAAPVIERLLAGLGAFLATLARQIFGNDAAAVLNGITIQAEDLVKAADADAELAVEWLKGMAPDLEALLAMFPGLAQSLYARYTIMADNPSVTHGMAAKVVEAAHANIRVS